MFLDLPRLSLLLSCPLILASCVQRTVTHSESRVGFSDAWAAQLGDQKKIREKFASGFEIEDGVAVATKKNNFELKSFEVSNLEKKTYTPSGHLNTDKKSSEGSKTFDQLPEFRTASANVDRKPFFGSNRKSALANQEFGTGEATLSKRKSTGWSKVFSDGSKKAHDGQTAAWEGRVDGVRAQADLVQESGRLLRKESSLTEQQVRDLLHPEG